MDIRKVGDICRKHDIDKRDFCAFRGMSRGVRPPSNVDWNCCGQTLWGRVNTRDNYKRAIRDLMELMLEPREPLTEEQVILSLYGRDRAEVITGKTAEQIVGMGTEAIQDEVN